MMPNARRLSPEWGKGGTDSLPPLFHHTPAVFLADFSTPVFFLALHGPFFCNFAVFSIPELFPCTVLALFRDLVLFSTPEPIFPTTYRPFLFCCCNFTVFSTLLQRQIFSSVLFFHSLPFFFLQTCCFKIHASSPPLPFSVP